MITVLFARKTSVYKTLNCDVWDADRDARLWLGKGPIIAHPPCRAWGRFAHVSKHEPAEKQLALWSLEMVRTFGGILEHPVTSRLWDHLRPGDKSLVIDQFWFGHRAQKRTRLFYSQVDLQSKPLPFRLGTYYPVEKMCKAEREKTPPDFARFLVDSLIA